MRLLHTRRQSAALFSHRHTIDRYVARMFPLIHENQRTVRPVRPGCLQPLCPCRRTKAVRASRCLSVRTYCRGKLAQFSRRPRRAPSLPDVRAEGAAIGEAVRGAHERQVAAETTPDDIGELAVRTHPSAARFSPSAALSCTRHCCLCQRKWRRISE